jgi:type IV fimbrial biogenesis protein FimT
MDKRNAGFTLLELIIALAIFGIVAVGIVPAVGDIMTRNRATTVTNEFIGALNYARSEAVTRTRPITMCRMDSTAGQCTQTNIGTGKCVCVTTDTDDTANGWEDGWLTFIDIAGNGVVETANGDELLQVQASMGGSFTVRGNSTAGDLITFTANGTTAGILQTDGTTTSGVSAAAIAICASGTDASEGSTRMDTARAITIIRTGRARAAAFSSAAATNCNL